MLSATAADPRARRSGTIARQMRLSDLLSAVPGAELWGDPDAGVTDVTYRSGEVTPGALFFCVPGDHVDGHDFAPQAEQRGAGAVVVERWVPVGCPQVLVSSVRRAMGPMSSGFFGRPSAEFVLAGVTGTNGKTTTTYLLEAIFRASGMRPGILGTTGVRIDGRPVPFDRTTPEAPDLQRLLRRMVEEGIGGVAMEVSSHGLDQHRVDGCRYGSAVFTNLSQDHLDYHGTMEAYFEAKARLFTPDLSEAGVVNVDTTEGKRLADQATIPVRTFGVEPGAEVRAEDVSVTSEGLSFRVGSLQIRSRLRGHFNASNCLGAVAAARQLSIDDAAIAEGVESLAGVPGRLEPVDAGQPFAVLVDYAHTPDSVDNVLRAARRLTQGRVIVTFGCGGDRDRLKRPLMGEAATRLADFTVVTSDNPRSEDPLAIIEEVVQGTGTEVEIDPDRRGAIAAAIGAAQEGDIVVIAGKGHEQGQEIAGVVHPFDDREVARELLRRETV
jgi:UDP-N-acetylmuramoyl-L-alanyl-D-glutamate--2,6-diaminopimelate ligase